MSKNRDKILKKLISIPSYYPNIAGIRECEQFIKEFLDQISIQDACVENVDGNIIFSLKQKGAEKTIAILLHYDTIPPFNPNDPTELVLSKDGLNRVFLIIPKTPKKSWIKTSSGVFWLSKILIIVKH